MINKAIDSHSGGENFIVYFTTPFNEFPVYQHQEYSNLRIQDILSSIEKIDTSELLGLRNDLSLRSNMSTDEDN